MRMVVAPISFVLLIMTLSATAADHRNRFEDRMFKDAAGKELPYRLLYPKDVKPDDPVMPGDSVEVMSRLW